MQYENGMMEQKDPEYVFATENPFAQEADPYSLGLRLFKEVLYGCRRGCGYGHVWGCF